MVPAVPRILLRFQRRLIFHHAEDEQPESGYAVRRMHEDHHLRPAARFRVDRVQHPRRGIVLLDHLRAYHAGSVHRRQQGIQSGAHDRKLRGTPRRAHVPKRGKGAVRIRSQEPAGKRL